MAITPVDIGSIAVAAIAAGGAWASQRAASKASVFNTTVTSRLDAEKEAYERARQFDIDTINHQQAELTSLRTENKRLHSELDFLRSDNDKLHEEIRQLRLRMSKLEHNFPDVLERMLRERLTEDNDPSDSE